VLTERGPKRGERLSHVAAPTDLARAAQTLPETVDDTLLECALLVVVRGGYGACEALCGLLAGARRGLFVGCHTWGERQGRPRYSTEFETPQYQSGSVE
jgi:hypothetical protein